MSDEGEGISDKTEQIVDLTDEDAEDDMAAVLSAPTEVIEDALRAIIGVGHVEEKNTNENELESEKMEEDEPEAENLEDKELEAEKPVENEPENAESVETTEPEAENPEEIDSECGKPEENEVEAENPKNTEPEAEILEDTQPEIEEIDDSEAVNRQPEENEPDEIVLSPDDVETVLEPMENGTIAEKEKTPESDSDDIIIDHEIINDVHQKRSQKALEFATWLSRLKPEHLKTLKVNSKSNYIQEFVMDEPFMELAKCREIAEAYKLSESLEDLVDQFEMEDEEMVLVAICIAILEDKNSLNVPFVPLCEDRVDRFSIEKAALFLELPECGVSSANGPLKLMQFTITTPPQCLLLMIIIWLSESELPCELELSDEVLDAPAMLDENEVPRMIVETAIKYWHELPENGSGGGVEDQSNQLDDFFRELEMTQKELSSQMQMLKNAQDVILKTNLKEVVPPPIEDELAAYQCLTPAHREKLQNTTAMMDNLKDQMRRFTEDVERNYNKKVNFVKLFIMKPGDYCLARKFADDKADMTFGIVEEHVDQSTYRIKFLDTNEVADVGVRDLAMLHTGLANPLFVGLTIIGVRVAVRRTVQIGPNRQKEYWCSGTLAGRHNAHAGDFLIFMDNGEDDYVTCPMKPGDPGYDVASVDLIPGEPWDFDKVKAKAVASNMLLMVGQSVNADGQLDRFRVGVWLRDGIKGAYLREFMRDFPEWQLLRMPIGMRFILLNSLNERHQKSNVIVVQLDRAFAVVRYMVNPSIPGHDCLEYPCTKGHPHRDEKIYRGSHRLEGAAQKKEMLSTNNNLSKRRKGQFASQFEPTEMERSMPIRKTQLPVDGPRNASDVVRSEKNAMPRDVVESRKRRQGLITKTINKTPVLVPLEELKPHDSCGPDCLQNMDSDPYDSKFHRCSPLHTPLMSGWRRHKLTLKKGKKRTTWRKVIIYYAPCGRPLENMSEISEYLQATRSQLTIDCFSFEEEVDTETYITVDAKYVKNDDFSGGVEGIPIPVVNSVDSEGPPQMEYSKRRFQYDASVDISSINRDFCSGCSCQGDCSDATKCECQQLSVEAMRLMPKNLQYNGKEKVTPHYTNRVLHNKVITGMYECNDQCSCHRKACHNRVVQNNIKYPMQIFKTAQSGWGVRALTDIPEGAFICNYVGALLTNDLADQLKNDDQYFADLDLKDAVEIHKCREDTETDFGYGDELNLSFSDSEGDFSDDDKLDQADHLVVMKNVNARGERNVQTRQDRKRVEKEQQGETEETSPGAGEMFSWDDYFKESSLFVVDAKQRGNLGRFLNHSCDPNVQVQHVMYDTHDLRLPWVAFFTTKLVKAGEELCWDYAYTVLNPDVERLSCYCGAPNCRRRLL